MMIWYYPIDAQHVVVCRFSYVEDTILFIWPTLNNTVYGWRENVTRHGTTRVKIEIDAFVNTWTAKYMIYLRHRKRLYFV